MNEKILKWLYDIEIAIEEIDGYFENRISKSNIGLRNQVIHAYDNISDENIWSILINHLPELKTEVDNLIQNNK